MAAKKTATKKNISFESLDSVDSKKEVNLKAGTEAVQTPTEKVKAKAKAPAKPKPAPKVEKSKKEEELIRVTVDIPKSEHKRLKIKAMEQDKKLYQYVLEAIRKELNS